MSLYTPMNGTLGWKLYSYLEKYPNNYDAMFSVGSEKTIVKALKIILISSSSVFEGEFKEWEQAVLKEGDGIPLPDLDPEAFKLFVKLMILDTWSVDALKSLKLPSGQLLHLMTICQTYDMTFAVESLTELVKEFLRDFNTYVTTDDFLQLSGRQLELILAFDEIPMNEQTVCQHVCKWADEQCQKQGLEMTNLNRRQVLGNCLYQIRFPLMSCPEFSSVTRLNKGLLSTEEAVEVFQFIGMAEKESFRKVYDTKQLKFKEKNRIYTSVPRGCSVVSVGNKCPVIDTPFVCDGSLKENFFIPEMKITLHGVGFVGPIDQDSFYDVSVQIWKRKSNGFSSNEEAYADKVEKRIFAEKLKTFYFIFDKPVILERIPYQPWSHAYIFHFTLKGPNTRSLQYRSDSDRIYDGSREFKFYWKTNQLVEMLYNACNVC